MPNGYWPPPASVARDLTISPLLKPSSAAIIDRDRRRALAAPAFAKVFGIFPSFHLVGTGVWFGCVCIDKTSVINCSEAGFWGQRYLRKPQEHSVLPGSRTTRIRAVKLLSDLAPIFFIVALILIYLVYALCKARPPKQPIQATVQQYCTACGCVGFPVFREEGSWGIELLLYQRP